MQLGGIGNNHSAEVHQVTACLHDHNHSDKGGAGIQTTPGAAARQALQAHQEQQAQLSLTDWVQRLLKTGKQKLLGFWNGNEYASVGEKGEKTGESQVIAQINDTNVTSSADISKESAVIQNSPYFAAVPTQQPPSAVTTLPQRMKLKFGTIAGQLTKHLPGKFFNFQKKGSFQAKKEGNREDLRRRSKYREDELEIDCILTDESYLLDSYDRKGEYSKLTTTK